MNDQSLPVDTEEFWQERIYKTIAMGGMLHQIIWDDSYDLWNWMQSQYAGILIRHILPGASVLDAGCGYGALLSCFEEIRQYRPDYDVDYTGVDFSPDLIRLARLRYSGRKFDCHSLYQLPYVDGQFDWIVMRSVDGMLADNLGRDVIPPLYRELRRVGKQILTGGYPKFVGDEIPFTVETVAGSNL